MEEGGDEHVRGLLRAAVGLVGLQEHPSRTEARDPAPSAASAAVMPSAEEAEAKFNSEEMLDEEKEELAPILDGNQAALSCPIRYHFSGC